jgi:hypothetical protein
MNLSQVRVTDQVFTQLAHGYTNPRPSVASYVAPIVPVNSWAGKIIKFGKGEFSVSDTKRAPGTNIKREGTSYSSESFSLTQDALAAELPFEFVQEANQVGLNNLKRLYLNKVLNKLMLGWEDEVLSLVTNPANFEASLTSTVSAKWDVASDPLEDIFDAKEAVRAQSAVYPNSMLIGPKVGNALMRNEKIRDQFKYTTSGSISLDMLAGYFGLSRGVRLAEQVKEVDGALVDLMPADSVLLFYAPPVIQAGTLSGASIDTDMGTPSFAYTYTHKEYPVVTPYREDLDRRVFVADVLHAHQAIITGLGQTGKAGAGFLFTDVLS